MDRTIVSSCSGASKDHDESGSSTTATSPRVSPRDSDMRPYRLNIPLIESSLEQVQADFDRINRTLSAPRDPMTDEVRENMVGGYRCVDDALAKGLDLFELGNSRRLLDLNILVLCGAGGAKHEECTKHVSLVENRFYEQEGGGIRDLMEWLVQHKSDDVWRRAAGTYLHVLSQPQLFIEGNHRAGALIMSYILAREGKPPFVLSIDNAKAFFDPSSIAKAAKRKGLGSLILMPKLKKRFAKLVKEYADKRYLI